MSTLFTPCPACGAVGEVNNTCQFCGTTIILKEGTISSSERIPKARAVTPQEYAEKISIYHKVKGCSNSSKLMHVCIGDEKGLINLNGDLIYPLQHKYNIEVVSDIVIFLSKDDISSSRKKGILLNLKTNEEISNVTWAALGGGVYYTMGGRIDLVNFKIIKNEYVSKFNRCIKDVRKNINIDNILLTQIKEYIQKVKGNSDYSSPLYVWFDNICLFHIINNKSQPYDNTLSYMSGVSIYAPVFEWENKDIKILKECKLYDLFREIKHDDYENDDNDDKEPNSQYLNFSFDSESLCAAVQYLAERYGYSSDKIKLEEFEKHDTLNKSIFTYPFFGVLLIIAIIWVSGTFLLFYGNDFLEGFVSIGCMIWVAIKLLRFSQE